MPWRPGQREAQRALEAPYEDVPEHLVEPLVGWVKTVLLLSDQATRAVALRLRVRTTDAALGFYEHRTAVDQLERAVLADHDLLLDTVEFLLTIFGPELNGNNVDEILQFADSAYCVRSDGKGLEMRVLPEVRQEVQAVVDEAVGSPGAHLANAWSEAYGRTPDPVKAYSEAIKAVESAAAPVISPKNLKATLGTLIKNIESKPRKWTFAITSTGDEGVEEVARMMRLLWSGQTSRHGGVNRRSPVVSAS